MDFDGLRNLLERNRTYRRFDGTFQVEEQVLLRLVELTRYCASGRNLQPLAYRLVTGREECAAVYPTLAWAGYYRDWAGPAVGERPTAYLVQCLDTRLTPDCLCDDGLQLEAVTLGATALGLGCCIIKSFDARMLAGVLSLPGHMKPRYVVAVGKPVETVAIDNAGSSPDASVVYYRDSAGVHHVPKRPLEALIVGKV